MQLNLNNLKGTKFQKRVWKELLKIPFGETRSYKEIAISIGTPNSYRSVANACGKNPYRVTIPCHRAIKSNGSIGGYSAKGGIKRKRMLLANEINEE